MTQRRDPRYQREEPGAARQDEESRRAEQYDREGARQDSGRAPATGQSSFARIGQSTEERMRDDDSSRRFPGGEGQGQGRGYEGARPAGYPYRREDYGADRPSGRGGMERGYYGSGGSYGYGGGFEHRGQAGQQDDAYRAGGHPGRGNEEFYESTGGFGSDTSGYGRQGLGYPGGTENRLGAQGGGNPRGGRGYFNEDANRATPGRGYFSEDARQGFTQNSGYMQSGGEQQGQGARYGAAQSHSDGRGHEGGGQRRAGPSRGPFFGRTPRGYTRSDERIREDVCEQLSHGHIDPSEISVNVENGVVTLEGMVASRHEKFHVEELADAALGVKEVDNRLRVRRERADASRAQASGSESGESTKRGDNGDNTTKGARS